MDKKNLKPHVHLSTLAFAQAFGALLVGASLLVVTQDIHTDGYVFIGRGWPFPAICREGPVESSKSAIYCCSRCSVLTEDKLRRHPAVFILPQWEIFLPGLLLDLAIMLPLLFVCCVAVEKYVGASL